MGKNYICPATPRFLAEHFAQRDGRGQQISQCNKLDGASASASSPSPLCYNSAVRTETATEQPIAWRTPSGAATGPLIRLSDRRLALLLALALLASLLAYQAPAASDIAVGWPGDRLFLRSSEGAGADVARSLYGDELSQDARSGRSRWTRQEALIRLPGLGVGGDLTLTLRAQGWPGDVLACHQCQPAVTVAADGVALGQFTPTSGWADYTITIPASTRAADSLALTLRASDTFTNTAAYLDARPKGIRLEYVGVREAAARFTWPALAPLVLLTLTATLWMLALAAITRRATLAFVLTTCLVAAAAIGLALARVWAAALLPWLAVAPALALLYVWRAPLLGLLDKLLQRYSRGGALNYGLLALAAAWLAYVVVRAGLTLQPPGAQIFKDTFPDSLLLGLLGMGLLMLALVLGREGLPRLARAIVGLLGSRRGAPILLGLFAAVWIGYEASVVAALPYVGHADYADNAVVARNLLAGRGWVVDYVTQFYQLYPSVTHPQETWPLLQPVWIAPFFALFGATAWAAKIPNLIFTALLGLSIYAAGARLWDRRVGLTAAAVLLASQWFFFMAIQTTSDLAFVVFSFGAIYLLYRATTDDRRPTTDDGQRHTIVYRLSSIVRWRLLLGSSILTGLMMLQKPGSGVLIAGGMGLWFLAQIWRGRKAILNSQSPRGHPILNFLIWGLLALLILSPYLARNLLLFQRPFYTTEGRDAWVLGYGDWEDIYKVYVADDGLSARDDLPEPSWVLRWGFDRTLRKVSDQAAAVRDYLAPPWANLASPLGDALAGREDKSLLSGMGAWLALLGALGALRTRRRLLALLLAAFVPYTLFLTIYWHANEERYFVMLLPWLALLAAHALWRGYDRIAAIGDGRWTPIGLALAAAVLVMVAQPSWPKIAEKVRVEPLKWAPDVDAYDWLRQNTGPGDVIMTRGPWQLNWHSQRPALMVPNTGDRRIFLRLAHYYHVRYLVRDTLSNPSRQTIDLIDGLIADQRLRLQAVYTSPVYWIVNDRGKRVALQTEVYRFPENYDDLAELGP
jgi:4-amino-4-deoxy-L-arabinose transferase-like glycosyltransferase